MLEPIHLQKGDRIRLSYGGRSVLADVMMASGNGKSLLVSFEAILGGYVSTMPISWVDEQGYCDLVYGHAVYLEKLRCS